MPPQRITPGPGQESVWDYPRPPRIEVVADPVRVVFNGVLIADSNRARRVLETSHPPVYYLPMADVRAEFLRPSARFSSCEWKGRADYYHIKVGDRGVLDAAWSYHDPIPAFESIRGHVTFYPERVDACTIGDRLVTPQQGAFYGGWITPEVVGPFKGGPGTWGW